MLQQQSLLLQLILGVLLLLTPSAHSLVTPSRTWVTSSSSFGRLAGHGSLTRLHSAVDIDSDKSDKIVSKDDNNNKNDWIRNGFETDDTVESSSAAVDGDSIKTDSVLIYDTSLRDGTQGESVSASANDKLKIASRLIDFGVDYVEAGWPGSNPKDAEFFDRAKTEFTESERSKLSAFGSTRRKNVDVNQDKQIQALLDSEAPTVCLVAKAHEWQVTDILQASLEENLCMISDSVKYLTQNGRQVFVDLEHFFDGYHYNSEYSLECCKAAVDAGAKGLVLCDTNGGSMPWQVEAATKDVREKFGPSIHIGIHAHNDCGLAVANSLTACKAGADMVQGTINGIGERTGNADLTSIIPVLGLKMDSKMTCAPHLSKITSLSRFVDEILNRTPNSAAPFVGTSAFAHKGGLHVAAMKRSPDSYQHINPTAVGNEQRVLISELSGRQNILGKIQEAGIDVDDPDTTSQKATAILQRVKELESRGYTFEGAEASVHIMILHASKGYCPPFSVLDYSAQVFDSNLDPALRKLSPTLNGATSRATIKVRMPNFNDMPDKDGNLPPLYVDQLEVSDGNGPVDALASALKRALVDSHPSLQNVELVDYKVRILDPESATAAATRVMVEFRDTVEETTWTTVSVDRNVISASLNAVVDGFEYALIEYAQSCMLCDDEEEDE